MQVQSSGHLYNSDSYIQVANVTLDGQPEYGEPRHLSSSALPAYLSYLGMATTCRECLVLSVHLCAVVGTKASLRVPCS